MNYCHLFMFFLVILSVRIPFSILQILTGSWKGKNGYWFGVVRWASLKSIGQAAAKQCPFNNMKTLWKLIFKFRYVVSRDQMRVKVNFHDFNNKQRCWPSVVILKPIHCQRWLPERHLVLHNDPLGKTYTCLPLENQ